MNCQDYLSAEEIAAHESAMQAVRDKRATSEQRLGDEIERLQKATEELIDRLSMVVKVMHEQEELELEHLIMEQERRVVLQRIYHEAPHDIMELIVKPFSDVDNYGVGKGGMNVLRLVSKRLMRVVESCATRLIEDNRVGLGSCNVVIRRCRRIEHVRCFSLMSLEGCPVGLKTMIISIGDSLQSLEPLMPCTLLESLQIWDACQISDLTPLTSCTRLKKLLLSYSRVSDISALSSMPLLEELTFYKKDNQPSIKDLSPLAQCQRLRVLDIGGNRDIEDISPLAQCTRLERLELCHMGDMGHGGGMTHLNDLEPLSSLTKLKYLEMSKIPLEDLTPLSALQDLEDLWCLGIPLTTSLLPLARCRKLKKIHCSHDARDLNLLREKVEPLILGMSEGAGIHEYDNNGFEIMELEEEEEEEDGLEGNGEDADVV